MTYIAELQALLDQGAFATARELVSANGTSPNGGHTSQDPDFMARFATATHREALRAFQAGRGEAAAALVLELLTECPLWNEDDLGGEPAYVLRLGTPEQPRTARLRATEEHHRVVNDFGFFLAEDGRFELAIELLSQVVQLAPDRTVAYLNLADAQWEAGDRPAAKARYSEYVERMGKTEGVAPRALQRRSR